MSDTSLQLYGLSGDHGWNEGHDDSPPGLATALLLATTGAYFAATWLLGGLAPMPVIRRWRTNVRTRRARSEYSETCEITWRRDRP